MLSRPNQHLSKTTKLKKVAKSRSRRKQRVILGILGDAGKNPQRYIARFLAQRGAE